MTIRNLVAVLGLALAACGAAIPPVPSQGGPAWRELMTDHFVLWTDGSPARAHELMREMEHLRQIVVGVAFPTAAATSRVLVIALRDDDELAAFTPTAEARAFASPKRPPGTLPMIVVAADSNSARGDLTVAHELTHAISFAVIHDQPRWFAEGLAMFFETVGLDPTATIADIGVAPQSRGRPARLAKFVPIASLLAWHAISDDEARLYSTAWALFTFLMNKHSAELAAYMQAIEARPHDPPELVWTASFPSLPLTEVDAELRNWIVGGHHTVVHFKVEPHDWPVTERALADADVFAARALMRCNLHGCAAAATEIAAALAADPANVLARAEQALACGPTARGPVPATLCAAAPAAK